MSAQYSPEFLAFSEQIQQYPGFVSLVEEGSVAAGDPWQEGYSDHDIHVVTEEDYPTDVLAVRQALMEHPLGDNYFVTHHRLADFVREGRTLNDLSVQYRSAPIVGEDWITMKPPYPKGSAMSHGYIGLREIDIKLDKRLLNGESWGMDRLRHESYDLLKKWFCYNAAIVFGREGEYPRRREDVVRHLPDQQIGSTILRVTHSIATAERYELVGALSAAKDMAVHMLYPPREAEFAEPAPDPRRDPEL